MPEAMQSCCGPGLSDRLQDTPGSAHPESLIQVISNSNTKTRLSPRLGADGVALDADATRKEASLEIRDNRCCFINSPN